MVMAMQSVFSSMKIGVGNNILLAYYNRERDGELIKICREFCCYSCVILFCHEHFIVDYDKAEVKEKLLNNWVKPIEFIIAKKPYSICGYHAKFKAYLSYCRVMKSNGHGKYLLTFFLKP